MFVLESAPELNILYEMYVHVHGSERWTLSPHLVSPGLKLSSITELLVEAGAEDAVVQVLFHPPPLTRSQKSPDSLIKEFIFPPD